MHFQTQVTILVNGRAVQATVTVAAPGLDPLEDYVTAPMVLTAVANNQNLTYTSRHHKDRNVSVLVAAPPSPAVVEQKSHLRRVA